MSDQELEYVEMSRRKRIVFTPEMKKIFLHLYDTHDNGKFRQLMSHHDSSSNIIRANAWQDFTDAFNEIAGLTGTAELSKTQLQNYHKKNAWKFRNSDPVAVDTEMQIIVNRAAEKRKADKLKLSAMRKAAYHAAEQGTTPQPPPRVLRCHKIDRKLILLMEFKKHQLEARAAVEAARRHAEEAAYWRQRNIDECCQRRGEDPPPLQVEVVDDFGANDPLLQVDVEENYTEEDHEEEEEEEGEGDDDDGEPDDSK